MRDQVNKDACQALGGMYVLHNAWLISWLHRKLGNRHDAADIAQDTFTRVCAGARARAIEITDIQEPRAYLTTVARRLMFNHLERQSLEQAYLASLSLLPEESVLSVEDRSILLETLAELDSLLNDLPAKVRTAFLLSQLDGLPYEEISQRMQVSVRTVTRYMAQGFRQCLRVMLEA